MPSRKILIADDNPQGVELLEAYLSGTDYDLQTAADGEETLRKVQEWKPDLILLDVMMPKISGFEVCKRLKANPATGDIVVLMVTALDQPSDIDRAVEVGHQRFPDQADQQDRAAAARQGGAEGAARQGPARPGAGVHRERASAAVMQRRGHSPLPLMGRGWPKAG